MMIKYCRLFCLSLLCGVALAGCATAPKLTQEQIFEQHPQIAELDKGLKDAAAQHVDNLAPESYGAARAKLDKALAEAEADRGGNADGLAAEGLQSLAEANKHADVSRDLLREVLQARDKAQKAGAASIFPERSGDLDEEFRKVANLVERNRLEDAKQRRPRLIAGYEQLELAALKEGTVEAAQAALAAAEKKDAPKFAPKTFKLAEEEMQLAQSVLEADRTKTEKANAHAKRAKWLAERSAAVTELIKEFDRREFSREDAVLWYQEQLNEISAPLDEPLPFNEPNRNVVLALQQSIKTLMKQRDDTAAQRSQYEQELSLSAEQQAAIEKVQSLFTPSQANVFQQRQNVLISAHGFRFPSGGSEIETENFALMNKIIQAVKTFPDGSIEISGHTDSTGSAEVNRVISQRRADNVAKFLVEVGGISAGRMMASGYGEERPVASNETTEGRAANRRVEILIRNP
jgi:outer membrane protein OmpA-like peptidoglycan-associated protein